MTPDQRLSDLGLELPEPAVTIESHAPWVIAGGILYLSGQLPMAGGKLRYRGRIGKDLDADEGYQACRLATLNALAVIRAALGSLDAARRIVRLEGCLNVSRHFGNMSGVLDGASDLVNQVFEERGQHSRMIYGLSRIPLDGACLVTLWAEV